MIRYFLLLLESLILAAGAADSEHVFSPMQVNRQVYQRGDGIDEAGRNGWTGIKLVGAGLPRTGSDSLHEAMRILGYHPSHGEQGKVTPGYISNHTGLYHTMAAQNIDAVFDAHHPSLADESVKQFNSKVVLSIHPRGADGWVDSIQKFTRYWQMFSQYPVPPVWYPANGSQSCAVPVSPSLVIDDALRESCKSAYTEYNGNIIKRFPSDRVLVYNVATRWKPLVKFAGKSVPMHEGEPVRFPHFDNVAEKRNALYECGFCGGLVNGHTPTASDVELIPAEFFQDDDV